PLRYAVAERVEVSAVAEASVSAGKARSSGGEWRDLPDGRDLWRLAVHAPGARALGFGFARMFLPPGAELYLVRASGTVAYGPYTAADNTSFGGFWTPVVPGDAVTLELVVPAALKRHLVLDLTTVNHVYRDLLHPDAVFAKSASCEIDVACPEGDAYRDPIRAVARYTFQQDTRALLCTGQLLNNLGGERKRYFHTADHCIRNEAEANSMVLYWNYQSPTCRSGSADNAAAVPLEIAVVQTGGATLRAHYAYTDFSLVELYSAVPPGANA